MSNDKTDPKSEYVISLGWDLIILILLVLPCAIWNGFCLSHLWKWFFVPLGLPFIGTLQFAGISLFKQFVWNRPVWNRPSSGKALEKVLIAWFAEGLLMILAYGIHLTIVHVH